MEKVGRRRDEVWERVTLLEGGRRWKCNDCGEEFAGGASRIKAHVNKLKGTGIRPCTSKANSNNDSKHNLLHSQGQIQTDDATDQESTQDLQMVKRYAFECLRPEDKVIVSPLSYLTQEVFITLKPETSLDSLVIDTFVEILTDIERKNKTMPSNWYLPVTFSDAAIKGKVGHFLNFVHYQKITENYMSDLESCEKIFIPVHIGATPNGHFYLYIIHLKSKETEIWDSLPNTSEMEETTKKLLTAMEKLFEKVTFTEFHTKMADDILLQPNGFDCGVFVINYMQQSDNYVKRDSSFQFDSKKEREDLALKLLNSDLNKEKQNLYDKVRRHYAQVDTSKEKYDDLEKGQTQADDAEDQEKAQDSQMMKQYVLECLRPEDKVIVSPLSHLTQEEFITLKPETSLDSLVIDVFVEILTDIERKKNTKPLNWYLPVTFSDAALKGKVSHFLNFVHCQKITENYMSDLESCDKIFIPIHVGARPNGHFYLYIIDLKNKEIEIWDSLPNTFEAEIEETTKKLLIAMEKLFEKVTFTEFHLKMADHILLQPNGYDCGVFVINYMHQSDNYVKGDGSFEFDSQKEREDLALKLLNNDLNKEKQNLYDKARRHYAQVEKQDGNKRLRLDPSKELFEDVGREMENDDGLENGKIQGDAKYQERIQVGSSFVSNWDNEDLQMIRFVFECLSPGELVFRSPRLHLTQNQFITLKPGIWLDSWVIDIFVEILMESEKKKATPSNCYLPVMFSKAALKHEHNFKDFVQRQNIRENYLFHIRSPEKVFIPVHTGQETHGHFYLYIFHINKKVVEIWDSLPTFVTETDRDETTKKLAFAMEILFKQKKGAFSNYQKEMANDILHQDNGFDCGVFVINYMQQSDNYVKIDSSFQFDSQKEREDLALKLLTNDLNQKKQNLYDKARGRVYPQVEKHDCNERSRVDASETFIEAKYGDRVNRHDGLQKGSSKGCLLPTTDLIGWEFQRYTEQIWEWIMDDKVSTIGVWGIGGSGKTALATHIHNKLILDEVGSDMKVIWVTISQKYSISHLQKVIARSIELDISDEFEVKRIAGKLLQAFEEMKKCVLILDDVWDHFFLEEVGFPMSDKQVKLILTTRIWEVCQGMGCEKNTVKVESLDEEVSWALFQKIMGFHEELSLEVKEIAQNISRECEGLPLAIIRIAKSMKGEKRVREWSHMLESLKNLGNGQYERDKWVLPVLKYSYNFLTKKLQRFFLYYVLNTNNGCLNGDDANHFIRRFVYESIDETKKLRVQYDEGYNMWDRLKNHSMLKKYGWQLRMNKFLRAMAIGIAEDTGKIMANAYKNLTKIPSDDQWKDDLQKAFLTGNMIKTIPYGTCLRCSQLSTLLLDGNENLNYLSEDSFKNMPTLKTLDLSRTGIKRLPESVSSLKCLNVLQLSGCKELRYIPPLRNLTRLILLDLSLTAITEAPKGLESLINLRCLNLLHTPNLIIPTLFISNLINLECLELDGRALVFIPGLENVEVIAANFDDTFVFNTYMTLLHKHRVRRSYHFTLRNPIFASYYEGINTEYSMKRITFEGMALRNRKAVLPGDIKELVIDCQLVGTVGSCLCNVLSYGHNNNNNPHQIERMCISWCKDMKYLCCFSGICPFCSSSQLVGRLCLLSLKDLIEIVSPDGLLSVHQPSLFSHLTHLEIRYCDKMETLMTPKLLALLKNLCTISVFMCSKMKEIVGEHHSQMERTASGDLMALVPNHLSHPTPITLPKLTSLMLNYMPQLNFVYKGIMLCPSLQTFSSYECEKLNPPRIEISNGCELPMEKTSTGYHWGIKTY
ncbi:hypothetical protein QN277_010276 [Acacia crassicarpa]|uniref:Ubiquitin-like protease family profile domain-containing protein n=1 Tax=Acacia crassicarpa TaxID=499986 RepID=A0AAE1M8R3_9FABA|nr:hypothetical protein QN277_010276 [Acacia crassicarpa]